MQSPHLHVGAPGIFSHLLISVKMLKRDWGVESNGKLLHLFNPWKNCSLGSRVCGGRPAFGRTAAWVPALAGTACPWLQHSDDDDDDDDDDDVDI